MGEHRFLYLVGVLKIVSFNLKFPHENIKANKSGSLMSCACSGNRLHNALVYDGPHDGFFGIVEIFCLECPRFL